MKTTTKTKKRRKGKYHRGDYTSSKSGVTYRYRSGWELQYMQFLDLDPTVFEWSYETSSITYISNKSTGRTRKYIPDFQVKYLDGRQELVEIKPKRKLSGLLVQKKITAAKEWCEAHQIAFKIITEVELKAISINIIEASYD